MKIATYNVNGVRSRVSNLLTWLDREQPDIACLQELKGDNAAFPVRAIIAAGYESVWSGQRSWNGVAILAREKITEIRQSCVIRFGSFTEKRKVLGVEVAHRSYVFV
jgi:exonuclease III